MERTTVDPSTAAPTTALHGILGLVSETTAGATTYYIRDAGGSLIYEKTPAEGDFYFVYDGRGSVIALVDPAGTQRAAYTYDPYGDHAAATAMNGTLPPNPWRWSGSYLDATGLYKMGARYYDPIRGRFTQVDPVAGGSANGYDYCSGDPINCIDSTGTKQRPLSPEEIKQVGKIVTDCTNGVDTYFAASSFCQGFLSALGRGDLTDYGFGFVPNERKRYLNCPNWVTGTARFVGVGDLGRAYQEFGGDKGEAANTAGRSAVNYFLVDGGTIVLGFPKLSVPLTAAGTAIDAICSNI